MLVPKKHFYLTFYMLFSPVHSLNMDTTEKPWGAYFTTEGIRKIAIYYVAVKHALSTLDMPFPRLIGCAHA